MKNKLINGPLRLTGCSEVLVERKDESNSEDRLLWMTNYIKIIDLNVEPKEMSLEHHSKQLTRNCYNLRKISKLRTMVSKDDLQLIIHP